MTANPQWTRLLGTLSDFTRRDLLTTKDGRFVYVSGILLNSSYDTYLQKLDSSGATTWSQLVATAGEDIPSSLTEADDGSVYLSGNTSGQLGVEPPAGTISAFIRKFDTDGGTQWSRLYGDGNINYATGIKAASNSVYVTGYSAAEGFSDLDLDGFVYKLNSSGDIEWKSIVSSGGTDQPSSLEVASDGSVYITGITSGNLADSNAINTTESSFAAPQQFDSFAAKLNPDGSRAWTRLIGASPEEDFGRDLAIDRDDSVYIVGSSSGDLDGEFNNGNSDAFVSKYDKTGNRIWTRLIGTSQQDDGYGITPDYNGNIYITGHTRGIFPGQANNASYGGSDIFLAKLDTNGRVQWIWQHGSEYNDFAYSVAMTGKGEVFISGETYGNLGGQANPALQAGDPNMYDTFVIKFLDPTALNPLNSEPTSSSGQQSTAATPTTTPTSTKDLISPTSQPETSTPVALPSPNPDSPVLGVEAQETVRIIQLQPPLTIGSLQVKQAVVGTNQRDSINGSDQGEALSGSAAKDRITGNGGPDAFLFETPAQFGKAVADIITDFNGADGDTVAISQEVFGGITRIRFSAVTGKRDVKNAASGNKNFIYDDKSGSLFFNENGKKPGFGNGGEFAQLLEAPDFARGDLVIV